MYESIHAENFRCLEDLELDDVARVNLITGRNNVGKTALLEAIFLHCEPYNPSLALGLSAYRGVEEKRVTLSPRSEAPWDNIFGDFDAGRPVKVSGATRLGTYGIILESLSSREELRAVPNHIETGQQVFLELSSRANVLRLIYEGGKAEQPDEYYLILDADGQRREPLPPPPPFTTHFLPARKTIGHEELAERYGGLQERNEEGGVLEALRIIEPRLEALKMVYSGSGPYLHADLGLSRTVPLPFTGEGMVRLATLAIHLASAGGGVVLIDEVDNGLHYSVLPDVWKVIAETAEEFDTQVFAVTHNWECIAAAHRMYAERESYDFRLHRLERDTEGLIRPVTCGPEALDGIVERRLEVR